MELYQETSQAKDDLSAVIEYIAADNPDAAERFLRRVESDYRRLASAPELGRTQLPPIAHPTTRTGSCSPPTLLSALES